MTSANYLVWAKAYAGTTMPAVFVPAVVQKAVADFLKATNGWKLEPLKLLPVIEGGRYDDTDDSRVIVSCDLATAFLPGKNSNERSAICSVYLDTPRDVPYAAAVYTISLIQVILQPALLLPGLSFTGIKFLSVTDTSESQTIDEQNGRQFIKSFEITLRPFTQAELTPEETP